MWWQAGSEMRSGWLLSIIRSKLIIIASPLLSPRSSPHWTEPDSVIKICRYYFCTKHKLSSMLGTGLVLEHYTWSYISQGWPRLLIITPHQHPLSCRFSPSSENKLIKLFTLSSSAIPSVSQPRPSLNSEMLLMRSWRFQVKSALHPQFLAV